MDYSDETDFVLTFYEWICFLESDEAGDAFDVASATPQSARSSKYAIQLYDQVALFDSTDYDLALKMLRGELNL